MIQSCMKQKTERLLQFSLRTVVMFVMLAVMVLTVHPVQAQAESNEQIVFEFLTDEMGLNPAGACGVMSNIYEESHFIANINGVGAAYGICQWVGSRRSNLVNWCGRNGYSYTSLEGQLYFLKYELSTLYPSVLSYIRGVSNTADGAYKAGHHWCYYFEIPANTAYQSAYRGGKARDTWWPKYGSNSLFLSIKSSGKNAELSWTGTGSGGFQVLRSTSKNGTYSQIQKTNSSVKSWKDTTAKIGTTYYYQVASLSKDGKVLTKSNKVSFAASGSLTDSDCRITLSKTQYTYNKRARKPAVTVVYGGTTLKEGKSYTVSYSNNKNAGKATVTITGKGNYKGTVKKNFTIAKAAQTVKADNRTVTFVSDKTLSLAAKAKTDITLKSLNKKVAVVKNGKLKLVGCGTCRIRVKAKASENYKAAVKTVTLTVKPPKPQISKLKDAGGGKVKVSIKSACAPAGFVLMASTSKNFKTDLIRKEVKGKSSITTALSGLTPNKVWYFKVIGFTMKDGTKVYGKWSKTAKLKVK